MSVLPSLALPLANAAANAGAGAGRRYAAYPTSRNVRWLFPAGDTTARRAGIRELFRPASLKGRALKASILSGVLPGGRVDLDEKALDELEARMSGKLGGQRVRCVFYVGTPGAYRKATALVLSPAGETLAFAKIAATPPTRADVEAERRNLLRLSEGGALHGRVPEVLDLFDWQKARVLLTSGGPARPGPSDLSAEHVEFCARLADLTGQESTFDESPMAARISGRIERLAPRLPEAGPLLNRVFDLLRRELGPVVLRCHVAHRDFAPWNTRLGERGLFVFDWDRAEEGVTPLYDLFHFQAIQAALFGNHSPLPDRGFLRAAEGISPEAREHLPLLYLAYLLDMALLYGEARADAPEAGDPVVWNWFVSRLDDFLAEPPRL